MLVPFYNPRHPEETYENNSYKWIDLSIFLNVLSDSVVNDFKTLSAFKLDEVYDGKWDNQISKYSPISLWWDNFIDFKTFLIASKVFYTTGFTCKYWYREKWELTDYGYPHHGIDLILPLWTPIESFTDGEVYSVKVWDGVKKDAWNCVVIKSNNLYFCYEHLHTSNVKKWDKVKKWQKIWTCWETWNATTYHLHFQIDNNSAPFHPYWWKWEENIEKTYSYCVEPWSWLQENYKKQENNKSENTAVKKENKTIETKKENSSVVLASANIENKPKKENTDNTDLVNDILTWLTKNDKTSIKIEKKKNNTPKKEDLVDSLTNKLIWENQNTNNMDYIKFFENAWILKWDHGDLMLDAILTRYQMTLILYRMKKAWLLSLLEKNCMVSFKDISELEHDKEFISALRFVVCNNILHWDNWYFLAWNKLTWVQFLAIIWRIFWGLKDWEKTWYAPYVEWAENKGYITKSWEFLNKNITRQEVFKILYKLFE